MPFYSIIIPCYNAGEYVLNSLNSMLLQTFKDFEVVVVNDGSTDNTEEIITSSINNDSRFHYFYKENSGVAETRNFGIEKSSGRYILFLDADDFLLPETLSTIYGKIEDNQLIDIYSFGYQLVDEDKNVLKIFSNDQFDKCMINSFDFLKMYFNKEVRQCMCSFIVKRELLKTEKFESGVSYGEDQSLQIRLMYNAQSIYYDSTIFFKYLIRSGSAMNGKISIKQLDSLKCLSNLHPLFENSTVCKEYNNYLIFVFCSLFLTGIKKKGNKEYFSELNNYNYLLKRTTWAFNKYVILGYAFSKLYPLINALNFFRFKTPIG